jgi:hypothetical protein
MKCILKIPFCFVLTLLLLSNSVFAECWVVSDLKGYATNLADKYNFHTDRISGKKILVNIDGDNSSVSGSEEISFVEVTPQFILGVYRGGVYKGTVETWGIDIERRKVYYTSSRSGFTIFDGAKVLVGDVIGKCK